MEQACRYRRRPAYRASHIRKIKDLDLYAGYFTEVYNKAWAGHGGMKHIKTGTGKRNVQTI